MLQSASQRSRAGADHQGGFGRLWSSILVGMLFFLAACTGERPYLDEAGPTVPDQADGITTDLSTGGDASGNMPDAASQLEPPVRSDCQTVSGPGPLQVVIESVASTNPCVALATYQRIEFVNNTTGQVDFEAGSTPISLPSGGTITTDTAGTILPVGYTGITLPQQPIIGLWVVEPQENTLAGEQMGLRDLGSISVGLTPAEISADLGGIPIGIAADPCYVTSLEQDPYSPLLTVREGSIAVIQVFTPGQVTRSGIGVGSAATDVRAAYGARIEEQASPDGDANRSLLVFVPADEADKQYRLVFEVENGVVSSMRNGLTDQVVTNPGCP